MLRRFTLFLATILLLALCIAWPALPTQGATGLAAFTPDNAAQIRPLSLHNWGFYSYPLKPAFKPDGSEIILNTSRGTVQLDLVHDTETSLGNHVIKALSPDWKYAIQDTEIDSQLVERVDAANWRVLATLPPQDTDLTAFSPDSRWLVLQDSQQQTFQLWNTAEGKLISPLDTYYRFYIFSDQLFGFSPNSKYLAWTDDKKRIVIWDITANKARATIQTAQPQCCVVFLPDSNRLLTADNNDYYSKDPRRLHLWDVDTGREMASAEHGRRAPQRITLSPDGKRFVLRDTYKDGGATLWAIESDKLSQIPFDVVPQVDYFFSPDSHYMTVSLIYQTAPSLSKIAVIDATTGATVATLDLKSYFREAVFTPDSQMLVVHDADGWVRFFTWRNGKATELKRFPAIRTLLSPDGATMLSWFSRDLTAIYGIPSDSRPAKAISLKATVTTPSLTVRTLPSLNAPYKGAVSGSVTVSGRTKDNQFVYLPDSDGWVRPGYLHFDGLVTLDLLPVRDPNATPPATLQFTPQLTPSPTMKAQPTQPSATAAPTVQTVQGAQANYADFRLLGVVQGRFDVIERGTGSKAQFSADGKQVYLNYYQFGDQMALRVVNTDALKLEKLPFPTDQNSKPAISPSGEWAVYTDKDQIKLWNLRQGKLVRQVKTNMFSYHQALFTPDSTKLVLLLDGSTELWTLASGQSAALKDAQEPIAFSPDSHLLVTLGYTQSAVNYNIYDISSVSNISGEPLLSFPGEGPVLFSGDGKYMLGTNPSNQDNPDINTGVTVWDLSTGKSLSSFKIGQAVCFTADSRSVLATYAEAIQQWDITTGKMIHSRNYGFRIDAACNADGSVVAVSDPLTVIDVRTWQEYPIMAQSVYGERVLLSPDGKTLVTGDRLSTLIWGVPSADRPAWKPVMGHVVEGGTYLYARPVKDADIVGAASGNVLVSGRNGDGSFAYLPELKGWIDVKRSYLRLDPLTIEQLPQVDPK